MTAANEFAIVIDGSNVAHEEETAEGKAKIESLLTAIEAVGKQYGRVVTIVDAALRYQIDDPGRLEDLLHSQTVHQAPADTPADYFVLRTADQLNADVLSNDKFRQYHERWPWIEHRRIPYMVINGRLILYRPAQVQSRIERKQEQPS